MAKRLTGLQFNIGNTAGQYPAGTSITDSIFDLMAMHGVGIAHISYSNQNYANGWTVTGRRIDFPFTTSNGEAVYITFGETLTIGE